MEPITFTSDRLVKSEDLNHHRTLFAGRCAEWFVEAGFIAAASALSPDKIVCLKIHGLEFTHPVKPGDIVRFQSKIIRTGRTSLQVFVTLRLTRDPEPIVKGFLTFVHVDKAGKAQPHGLRLQLSTLEDKALNQLAENII